MPDTPTHFFDLTRDALIAWCADHRMPRFRADQLLQWVYQRGIIDPQQMTDFSKADRVMLASQMTFTTGRVVQHQLATDGTQKLLVDWGRIKSEVGSGKAEVGRKSEVGSRKAEVQKTDTAALNFPLPTSGFRLSSSGFRLQTECVMIPAESKISGKLRRTACISSQVGCPVGCKFCASGLGGLDDNLTAGRIVEQVWWLNQVLKSEVGSGKAEVQNAPATSDFRLPTSDFPAITHIVFMGMGEPLSNFNAVTAAVRALNAEWAFNLSGRRITISTVGLPAQIRRLADQLDVPVTLAISLHAPNDELRRQLIPWASFTTIWQILEAGQYYFEKTGREVVLEYILLRQVNDQPDHARELAEVAKTLRAKVNLIRYNEVKGIAFGRPDTDDVRRFQQLLQQAGVNTHIRASRGRDIAAACGQLRHEQASGAA
ncbi:MAG: 23S rRNA (adenine(2503)-C(2))-methyltransferase RlmN [Phycisphaeraceae bacterium]